MQCSAVAAGVACIVLSAGLCAQEGPVHAPDGRAPRLIEPLYFAPKPNAPFTATARTLVVDTLPDGSTTTSENARLVTRDVGGRIFQERVTFVPVPSNGRESHVHATDYTDPVEHTHYHCEMAAKVCNLFDYYAPVIAVAAPAGPQAGGKTYLMREDLGSDTFAGLEVQHSRETLTIYSQTVGNTRNILRTVEYWYSPALGVNVQVKRHDPRDGDQTLWLADLVLDSPDPEKFQVPADFRIVDHRDPRAAQPSADANR
jgi:hypothetical protein